MRGVAGVFHRDGNPVGEEILPRMLGALAHRGTGGSAIWKGSAVALGCTATPGSASPVEVLDDLVLVADARLDNRRDLAAALGLAEIETTDGALILAAYRRWGDSCAERLLGDFAFAIWDAREQALFCARDHFGVKPFYFRCDGEGFSFASELKGLFALAAETPRLNEAKIADFLVALTDDADATLYADYRRLPPRHFLKVTRDTLRILPYWRLEPKSPASDDFAEELRGIFSEAVRCRLRTDLPIGAMLSGGLDSSSIASVAGSLLREQGRGPLKTFSFVFDKTPQWSERPYIEAVLAKGGFEPLFLDGDDYDPFADCDGMVGEQDGIFLAPGLAVSRRVYRSAAGHGVRVLLDGHGGDEVISFGQGRLHELADAGRWLRLWREVPGISDINGVRRWDVFRAYQRRYRPQWSPRRAARRLVGITKRTNEKVGRPAWVRLVSPELAERTQLVERYRERRIAEATAVRTERSGQAQILSAPRVSQSFEILDRSAAAMGVEPRYPFWDKRVVEFCLSLPSEEKLRDGWSRSILRRAMEGYLPPVVQWRRDKLDFSPHVVRGLLSHRDGLIADVLQRGNARLGAYVDLGTAASAYQRIAAKPDSADGSDVQMVWRTVMLARWLDRLEARG